MKYQLGKTPIFIFSASRHDGDYFSLLLSNHLQALNANRKHTRPLTLLDNKYTHQSFNHWVQTQLESKSSSNIQEYLALVLQEGFDTDSLDGLSLPLQLFKSCALHQTHADAVFVFIYCESEIKSDDEKENLKSVIEFSNRHPEQCILLHSKYLKSDPLKVLRLFPSLIESKIVDEEKITAQTKFDIEDMKDDALPASNQDMWLAFYSMDRICKQHPFYNGQDTVFVLYGIQLYQLDMLLQRLLEMSLLFLYQPRWVIFCDDITTSKKVQDMLGLYSKTIQDPEVVLHSDHFSNDINQWIETHAVNYILIDNVTTSFSLADWIRVVEQAQPHFISFAQVSLSNEIKQESVTDVLMHDYVESNLLFSKSVWLDVHGFDSSLE